MTNKDYKIIRGRIEIEVPHEDGKLTFVWPVKGPGTYANVKSQIEDAGLQAPTFAQLTSLVYTANQNRDEPEFAEILNKLDNRWLWGFNGILYLPKGKGDYQNGAIIQDNPKTEDGRVFLDKSELIKKLEAGDKSVRFVPFGYKTDVQNASELAKNPFVIGLAKNDSSIRVYVDHNLDGQFKVENHQSGTANFAYQPSSPLTEGAHLLYTEALDNRGKVSSWSNITYFAIQELIAYQPTISQEAVEEKKEVAVEIKESEAKEEPAIVISPEQGTVETVEVEGIEAGEEKTEE